MNVNVNVANRRVTVDVQSTQNTYFARALGLQTKNVAVEGIAEAAEYSTGTACAKPRFIPNTVFSSSAPCTACTSNEVLISGGEATAFAQSKIGEQFTLKWKDPQQAIAPGQFYAIQLPGSNGGSDYKDNIASCANTYVRCGDFYSTETGNMVGPTKQGVQDLVGNPPTDTWTGTIGQYQTPNGLSDTSRNIVVSPVWDTCGTAGFCPAGNFPSGSATVQVIGFAAIFLEGLRGNDVIARLISISSCSTSGGGGGGAGGGGATNTGGTVLSVPLRLVRTQ